MKISIRTAAIMAGAVFAVATANSAMASAPEALAPTASPPISSVPSAVAPAPSRSLIELVDAQTESDAPNAEQECIAAAVYFEARGEPIEGQLAVAQVVMNRAASNKYPASICGVVKQRAQFSFVRGHRIPRIPRATKAWRKAVAIAHVAWEHLVQQIGSDVLWYHADHVSPGWGSRLTRVSQIGSHIFYSGNG